MEAGTPFLRVDDQGREPGHTSHRFVKVAVSIVAVAAGLLGSAALFWSSPSVTEFQELELSKQVLRAGPKETSLSASMLARVSSVDELNNIIKDTIATDATILMHALPVQKVRMLFDDFLATIGTQAPDSSGKLREKTHTYGSVVEYNYRLGIFKENLMKIMEQNKKEYIENPDPNRARFGVTVHADWTLDEFKIARLSLKANNITGSHKFQPEEINRDDIECSRLTQAPVRDQGSCGDCWAYSTAEQLRYSYYHKYREDVGKLSVQYLVDCFPPLGLPFCLDGVKGCCGGWPYLGDQWLEKNGGIPTQAAYGPMKSDDHPFTPYQCKWKTPKSVIPKGKVKFLKTELDIANNYCETGSVSIAIAADPLQHYISGVLTSKSCPADQVDHAVLHVGVDKYFFDEYPVHIVLNSWGTSWGVNADRPYKSTKDGQNGHVLFKMGDNTCNIKFKATVPGDVEPAP